MKTFEVYYHFSGLCSYRKSIFGARQKPSFLAIYSIIIFIIIINFFRRVFYEYTVAVTTSLIPIDTILPEICTFIVGYSCTAWTKMRSLRAH